MRPPKEPRQHPRSMSDLDTDPRATRRDQLPDAVGALIEGERYCGPADRVQRQGDGGQSWADVAKTCYVVEAREARSPGSRTPALRRYVIAPTAITSLTAKTTSTWPKPRRMSSLAARKPPSRVKSPGSMHRLRIGCPWAAKHSANPNVLSRAVRRSRGPVRRQPRVAAALAAPARARPRAQDAGQ
jgi:hypothetical protein